MAEDLRKLVDSLLEESRRKATLIQLWREILLDPHDDVVRHAYADALEEMGQAASSATLQDWLTFPLRFEEGEASEVTYLRRRGFVEGITCTLPVFLQQAESLFRQHPITRVTLRHKTPTYSIGGDQFVWVGAADRWGAMEVLPLELCAGWVESPESFAREGKLYRFTSSFAAKLALSTNAVNYGHSLAGLPPLPARQTVA